MTNTKLQIQDLWHKYPSNKGTTWTIQALNLSLEKGELVGLLGPSGCGKTTLLRSIAGFEKPSQGRIMIDDSVVSSSDFSLPPERRGVGMVFQDYALFPHLNAWQNICFGLRKGQDKERAEWLIDLLGLRLFKYRFPHQLSGGQKQRLALARALAPGNSIVVLDEPFSNLDVEVRLRLRSQLSSVLSSCSASAILVTHDPEEALAICDRVAVMSDGQLHQCSKPADIVHQPATAFVARFVLQRNVIPVSTNGTCLKTPLGDLSNPCTLKSFKPNQLILDEQSLEVIKDPKGKAIVDGREFHGTHWHLRVKLDSYVFRVWHPLENPLLPGQNCVVSFNRDDIGLLFPGCIKCPLSQ